MDGFLGEIRMFGGNFAPRSWALCQGQLLSISQNTALFSILGTTFGGDGRVTFALPDFRSRIPVGQGQEPGLSSYTLGEQIGSESHTQTISELAVHTHTATSTSTLKCNSNPGNDTAAKNNYLAEAPANTFIYSDTQTNTTMGAGAVDVQVQIENTGGSAAFDIRQPVLCVNFIICVEGIFPSRN